MAEAKPGTRNSLSVTCGFNQGTCCYTFGPAATWPQIVVPFIKQRSRMEKFSDCGSSQYRPFPAFLSLLTCGLHFSILSTCEPSWLLD